MLRYDECAYAVYFNTTHKHVTIHKIPCNHIAKNGGRHPNKNGGWGYFSEEFAAEQFAEAISKVKDLPLPNSCAFCMSG